MLRTAPRPRPSPGDTLGSDTASGVSGQRWTRPGRRGWGTRPRAGGRGDPPPTGRVSALLPELFL